MSKYSRNYQHWTKCWQLVRRPIGCLAFSAHDQLLTFMTSELASYFTCHQCTATSHIAHRCMLLKLLILSLTLKEFSSTQQNLFCLCHISLTLVVSRDFWKLGHYHYDIGTNFQIKRIQMFSQSIGSFYFSHEFHQTQAHCLLQGYTFEYDQGQHRHL